MYSCGAQSFILEHFLQIDTSKPDVWLTALRDFSGSPRLSQRVVSTNNNELFRARISCFQANNLTVLGTYLKTASVISGSNADTATLLMPVEGTVNVQLNGDTHFLAPWKPLLIEPNETFLISTSDEVDMVILRLGLIDQPGYRLQFNHQSHAISELLTSFLHHTPYLRSHRHARRRAECMSARLYALLDGSGAKPRKPPQNKWIHEERRLCTAVRLLNEQLEAYIDLSAIARCSGLSLRNFHYLMRQYTGLSPYQYLLCRRLVKAREAIIRDYPDKTTSIADQAFKMGFQHAGRFSGYYRKHFNEYPNETLINLQELEQKAKQIQTARNGTETAHQHWLTSSTAS